MKKTHTLALAAAVAMLSSPVLAVHPTSSVDHADVPNCTVLGPNANNCENVPLWFVTGSVGSGSVCSHPHPGTDPQTGQPIVVCANL